MLWNETIEAHRAAVRDAILETTAALVDRHGLASVTMSQIAETTGIGRATLYKYFPDVDSILLTWHEREVTRHLDFLATTGTRTTPVNAIAIRNTTTNSRRSSTKASTCPVRTGNSTPSSAI